MSNNTSPYFEHPLHLKDRLSIQLTLFFKPPKDQTSTSDDATINGIDLLWGNDFDSSIKEQLPYGTSVGLKIMKYTIDPSIDGDVYCDKPHLYGSALTSFNRILVRKSTNSQEEVEWPGIIDKESLDEDKDSGTAADPELGKKGVDETFVSGGIDKKPAEIEDNDKEADKEEEPEAKPTERKLAIPEDPSARSRFFLTEDNRKNFNYKRTPKVQYSFDFYTPYLDLGKEFAINLPGFRMNVESYANGQPLRYTLKNKATNEVYLVVVFDLKRF